MGNGAGGLPGVDAAAGRDGRGFEGESAESLKRAVGPYEALGIPRDATAAEIKAAHRRLAQRHHPDKGGKPEAFEVIQRAWFTLGDAGRRAKHDKTGEWDGPQPDTLDADAWGMIAHNLVSALCSIQGPAQAWDVRIWIVQAIDKTIRDANGTQKTADNAAARARQLVGKFKRSGRPSEHMDGALSNIQRDNELVRKQSEAAIRVANRAKELIHGLDVERIEDQLALYGQGASRAYTFHGFTTKT